MDTQAYLRKKAALTFEILDVSKSGILTLDQMLLFPNKLHAAGKHELAKRGKAIYIDYFNRMCRCVNKDPNRASLTKDEYLDAVEILRKTTWFRLEFLDPISDIYFDSVDRNGDNIISNDEWREMYKMRGIEDENFIQTTFAKMDQNQNGEISRDEFKRAFIQFGIGENQNEDFSFLYNRGIARQEGLEG